MNAQNADTYES